MNSKTIDQYEEVVKFLKEDELINLVMELVRIEGHKEIPEEEKEIAGHIHRIFEKEGIQAELQEIEPGRPNVYAFLGEKSERSIMLNGHIDTVPALGMDKAFQPYLNDGVIHGRGALDMKGAIAAMIMALAVLKRSGVKLGGQAIFTGVIDEEKRAQGSEKMADYGYPAAQTAITGEPTNLDIMYAHKGMEWIEVIVHGQSGHGSQPDTGKNAVYTAVDLIVKIRQQLIPELKKRTHPILGEATLNIGKIQGGDDPNIIPGICKFQIDRRWLPGETIDTMQEDIQKLIDEMKKEDPAVQISMRRMDEGVGRHYPLFTEPDDPFMEHVAEAVKKVTGKEPEIGVFQGWSDGAHLSRMGTAALVCGPGDLTLAHSDKEAIEADEVIKAAKIYIRTILNVLNG